MAGSHIVHAHCAWTEKGSHTAKLLQTSEQVDGRIFLKGLERPLLFKNGHKCAGDFDPMLTLTRRRSSRISEPLYTLEVRH